jgi:SAM-dependent methyltransferase
MSEADLETFYKEDYRKIYGGESPDIEAEKRHANNAYLIIKKLQGKLLDIGCSTGQLLKLYPGDGVEPSQYNNNTYRNISEVTSKYGIVTMLNALEHVYSPTKTLQQIYDLLEDEGYLLLSVPDLYNTNIKRPIDAYLSNAHLYNFSIHTLSNMLIKTGFKPVQYYSISEEIGNKLYVLSKKDVPQEIYCNPAEHVQDFLISADIVYILSKGGLRTHDKNTWQY